MKWFSHLAAMSFGIGFIEIVHELGLSGFGEDNPWMESIFWLMLSVAFLLGYLYEKRKGGESSPTG